LAFAKQHLKPHSTSLKNNTTRGFQRGASEDRTKSVFIRRCHR